MMDETGNGALNEGGAVAITIILPIIAMVAVASRFASRFVHGVWFEKDDWIVCACLVLAVVNSIIGAYTVIKGYRTTSGTDGYGTVSTRLRIGTFLYLNYMFCIVIFGLVKVSILIFYKRIFGTKKFVKVANITIGIVIGWMILSFIIIIVSLVRWSKCIKQFSNQKCTEVFVRRFGLSIVNASVDLALDGFILLMPVPVIKRLNVSSRKKIFLALNFMIGAFCLVAVILRIYYNGVISTTDITKTPYQTYLIIREQSYLWARIEANVAIIAACLPTLGPLIRRLRGVQSPFSTFASKGVEDIESKEWPSENERPPTPPPK